ncbi:MAG: hypothetical protein WD276_09915 [Actinomycetota bacterium]
MTDDRIEFSAQSPGGDFRNVGSYGRYQCKLVGSKRIPSGELLLIRHPDGVARLYFPAEQLEDALRIRDELTEPTIDPVFLVQEFAGLVDSPAGEEDEDY